MPDNITRVTRLGLVNAYLVREDDGLTLVDTMLPRSSKAILGADEGLGPPPADPLRPRSSKAILGAAERLGAPIVRIALTHAHGDHVGSLDDLAAALPGVGGPVSARGGRRVGKERWVGPGGA